MLPRKALQNQRPLDTKENPMAALRPIASAGLRDEFNPRSTKDIEDLSLFMVRQGSYADNRSWRGPFSRLSTLTSGSRAGGATQIRGGSL
jgi:hypothetical protein